MSHPSPAHMPGRFGGGGAPAEQTHVDPDAVVRDVNEILDRVDAVRRDAADRDDISRHDGEDGVAAGGPIDLEPLSTKADLLEQAHDVLTSALEQLDRV